MENKMLQIMGDNGWVDMLIDTGTYIYNYIKN